MDYFVSLGYEVHAISLPGHGRSSLNRENINKYRVRDYLDCLGEEIGKVTPKPVLMGHSMGGFLTLKYLESNRLPAAVLIASLPQIGALPFMGRLFRRHFRATLRMFATRRAAFDSPAMVRDMFLSADAEIDAEELHGKLVAESLFVATEICLWLRSKPEAVTTPTFVIAGEKDACFTVREQESLAKALKARYELLPGTAHNIMIEPNWRETADMIDTWMTTDLGLQALFSPLNASVSKHSSTREERR